MIRLAAACRCCADSGRAAGGGSQDGWIVVIAVRPAGSRFGRSTSVALLIAAVYGLALLVSAFIAPVYQSTSMSSSGEVTQGSETLVAVNGLGVALVIAVPLLATLTVGAALWRHSRRGAVRMAWAVTGLLAVFNLLAMMSIGVLVVPVTVALTVACATCRHLPGRQDAVTHPVGTA